MKIPEEIIQQIMESAKVLEVVEHFQQLKKSGSSHIGECPKCKNKKSFNVSVAKNIFKCFDCEVKGNAINYLMDCQNMTYPDALKWLANFYNIIIPSAHEGNALKNLQGKKAVKNHLNKKDSFRDQQLRQSGISDEDQKCLIKIDDKTEIEINRYESATINERWEIVPGDDMILHYIDLHGRYMTYTNKYKTKPSNLFRVRWQNPALHLDKDGDPIKYQTPAGGGSPLWIPEKIRRKYQIKADIETLYVTEGEKKADKMCIHGMDTVAVTGIHNIAGNGRLPYEFELIIKECRVKNVVFVIDADWQELRLHKNKAVDTRQRQFFSAVLKFHNYFYAFNNIGIHLKIYFGYNTDQDDKAIDDLLIGKLKGKEEELLTDFRQAMIDANGKGKYVNCHEITGQNSFKISEFFHLQNKEAFARHHFEDLKNLDSFIIGKLRWKFKPDVTAKSEDLLELAQPLLPEEEFWLDESYTNAQGKNIKRVKYHYNNARNFLQNRGFFRYAINDKAYMFVKRIGNIMEEVLHYHIRDFVVDFVDNINHDDARELILRGSKMYLGPDSLSTLRFIETQFHKSTKSSQYLYFRNNCWEITSDGIKEFPIEQINFTVWKDNIIPFDAKKDENQPLLIHQITDEFILNHVPENLQEEYKEHIGSFHLSIPDEFVTKRKSGIGHKSDFIQFLYNTGNFFWQDIQNGKKVSLADEIEVFNHMLNKMSCIGYLLHRYRDKSCLKAVIGMDGKISEVGASNGRSGKSLIGDALEQVIPTVFISGKRKDLTEDKYIWEEVTERTHVVVIDDTRVNIDFEFFFPVITGKMSIEKKGVGKFSLPYDCVPKIYLTTNHAINGEGGSFRDRQAFMAFSDYYNDEHKPSDDFGRLFFDEDWTQEQWNMFYNFMAQCLQIYFTYGIIEVPSDRLSKRKMRQQIGEAVIEWADTFYGTPDDAMPSENLGKEISRTEVTERFYAAYPDQRKYVSVRDFKKRLLLWCNLRGMVFNPGKEKDGKPYGGDLKTGGIEYFKIDTP